MLDSWVECMPLLLKFEFAAFFPTNYVTELPSSDWPFRNKQPSINQRWAYLAKDVFTLIHACEF